MFRIKQYLKMFLQNLLLPLVYRWYARKPVRRGLILFADAHHGEMPFSMRRMYEAVCKSGQDENEKTKAGEAEHVGSGGHSGLSGSSAGKRESMKGNGGRSELSGDSAGKRKSMKGSGSRSGSSGSRAGKRESVNESGKKDIQVFVTDFGSMSWGALLRYLVRFMKAYAQAEYVFICDYYLPVASCRKRSGTTVVQLWHSCGLMKKIAYDAGDDIPANYKGNMFGNYTWLTLSSEACVKVHARALRIPESRIRAAGVSRTDYYFDEKWNRNCREAFYAAYPEAKGKKIALWAPTFRGNAAKPVLCGLESVTAAAKELFPQWYFIIKAHPHIDAHTQVSNCSIATEELLAAADVLITDYSSVLYDYLIYEKPVVLFAPDLETYESGRGFYIDYRSMPFPLAQSREDLIRAVRNSEKEFENYREALTAWKEKYTGACDGHATERILKLIGM